MAVALAELVQIIWCRLSMDNHAISTLHPYAVMTFNQQRQSTEGSCERSTVFRIEHSCCDRKLPLSVY